MAEHDVGIWAAALASAAALALLAARKQTAAQIRHKVYQARAKRLLKRLGRLGGPGQVITYLRKVNPYVFEELVLTALQKRGVKVHRNRAYSGDGGVDGRFHFNDEEWWIQAKRYSSAVNPAHVAEFDARCRAAGVAGLFVHTGRTGPMSRQIGRGSSVIQVLSGDELLKLLDGRELRLNPAASR